MRILINLSAALLTLVLFSATIVAQTGITVGMMEPISTVDSLTNPFPDSGAEKLRPLLFDSLVKQDATLNYTGELAENFSISSDGGTIRFVLRDGIEFHDGRPLTSADVKYTFDSLFESGSYKAGAFYETILGKRTGPTISYKAPG